MTGLRPALHPLLRLVVTRPRAQAQPWVQALRAAGVDAHALPLIDIAPPADAASVQAAWAGLADAAFVMFVSANAVRHFLALRPTGMRWPAALAAGCTGPGTARELRAALAQAGAPGAAVAEPGPGQPQESESLWAALQAQDWRGRRVLVVRGEQGRDWLSAQWQVAGARVDFVAAYRRLAPVPDAAGRALLQAARAAPQAWVWHFSSSEAVGHLGALAPGADWSASAALVTHPRIAEAAARAGFVRVHPIGPGPEAAAQQVARLQSGAL
jgi:uroporphyrinogen-III synthase